MGEIADMMLDGTMCAGCGEWLNDGEDGEGFPEYCSSCAADGWGKSDERSATPTSLTLGKKMLDALERAAWEPMGGSMYPGDHWDGSKKLFSRLEKLGLVETYYPHNGIHKTRAVITSKGRAQLALQRPPKAKKKGKRHA